MNILKKLLSKKGRAAIYALAVAILGVAGTMGMVEAETSEQWLASLTTVLTSLAPILALFNLTDDEESETDA